MRDRGVGASAWGSEVGGVRGAEWVVAVPKAGGGGVQRVRGRAGAEGAGAGVYGAGGAGVCGGGGGERGGVQDAGFPGPWDGGWEGANEVGGRDAGRDEGLRGGGYVEGV